MLTLRLYRTLEHFLVIQKDINFVEIFVRKTIHYWQTFSIDHTSLILVVNPDYKSTVLVLFFFSLSHMWIFLDDEHRISIEGKSPRRNLTHSIVIEKCLVT